MHFLRHHNVWQYALKYPRVLAYSAVIVAVAIVLVFFYYPRQTSSTGSVVIVDGIAVKVEIADEPEEMTRGLMLRESLPDRSGMLFVFEKDGMHSFWMMNMRISLDIIWIDSNGLVVHIERNVPPCQGLCPSYQPKSPARFVLEVNSGFSDKAGLREGSSVKIRLNNPSMSMLK